MITMKKGLKIFLAIFGVLAIAAPTMYFGFQFLAGNTVENAEVTVEEVEVTSVSEDTLILDVTLGIEMDSPVDATFRLANVSLLYDGALLGNVVLSENEFSTTDTSISTEITVTITDDTAYDQLITDYVMTTSLNLTFNGNIEFLGALAALPAQVLSKEITLTGMNGLPLTVNSIELAGIEGDVLEFVFEGSLSNPSSLEVNVSSLVVDFYLRSTWIGNATKENLFLEAGANTITLAVFINGSDNSLLDEYINNETLNLEFNVSAQVGGLGMGYFQVLSENFAFAGLNGLNPVMESFALTGTTANELLLNITASIANPSQLAINMTEVWVDIIFEGDIVGNASVDNFLLAFGNNFMELEGRLGGNDTAMEKILGNYINRMDTDFQVNISLNVTFTEDTSKLAFNHEMAYVFAGCVQELISVDDMQISLSVSIDWGGSSATLTTYVDITINNPMGFSIEIDDFDGDILYLNTIDLGVIQLASQGSNSYPLAIPGSSSITDSLELHPYISFTDGQTLVSDGPTLTVDVKHGVLGLTIGNFNIVLTDIEILGIQVPLI